MYTLICVKQRTASLISLYESTTPVLSEKQNLCNYNLFVRDYSSEGLTFIICLLNYKYSFCCFS